jgi:ribosomal protein S19
MLSTSNSLPIIRPAAGQRVSPIRTTARSATILPNFVGLKFQVHNGKVYHDITVTEDMVGHKLGEFSPTRKRFQYKQTKNK